MAAENPSRGIPDTVGKSSPPRMRPGKVAVLCVFLLHAAACLLSPLIGLRGAPDAFDLLLLGANAVAAGVYLRRGGDPWVCSGIMALIMAHCFMGRRVASDELTSGAVLLAYLLVFYVGVKINARLPARHWAIYIGGFFALYVIFVLLLENAEPLFILFLLGLAACARSLRLTAYFWAFVASFTFFQPYAWETLFLSFFVLTACFSARGEMRSAISLVFLGAGLALVFLVLFPIVTTVFDVDAQNVFAVLSDARIRAAIRVTVLTATVSTLILAVFAVPLAYALSRLRFTGRTLALSLIDLPIVAPQSVAGIALLSVFGRRQVLGGILADRLGVPADGTVLGICLAQIFVAMPFMLKSAMAAFDGVDPELDLIARSLGASPWSAFRRVCVPLASRGIFMGAILAWARAAGEFGALIFIAPTPETAPVAVFNRFNAVGLAETGPLVAALLMFSLVMFFLLQLVVRLLPDTPGSRNA